MAEEEVAAEEVAAEPVVEAPPAIDPKDIASHPPVHPQKGNHCLVEGCEFIFGDLEHGLEPHPIETIQTAKTTVTAQPIVEPPPPKPSDAKCDPVAVGNECPKCHWKHDPTAERPEPHPVFLP